MFVFSLHNEVSFDEWPSDWTGELRLAQTHKGCDGRGGVFSKGTEPVSPVHMHSAESSYVNTWLLLVM